MDFIVIFLLLVIVYLTQWWYRRRRLPPGPPSIPILGCLPFINWRLPTSAEVTNPEYHKYGDIVRLDYGVTSLYVLNISDKTSQKALQLVHNIFKARFYTMPFFAPFLIKILPPTIYAVYQIEIMDFLREEVMTHERSFDIIASPPKDFIDAYLNKIHLGDDEEFSREQLDSILLDFLTAGSETLSTFMKWSFLFLALHPEVQQKCQEEIDQVLDHELPNKEAQVKMI